MTCASTFFCVCAGLDEGKKKCTRKEENCRKKKKAESNLCLTVSGVRFLVAFSPISRDYSLSHWTLGPYASMQPAPPEEEEKTSSGWPKKPSGRIPYVTGRHVLPLALWLLGPALFSFLFGLKRDHFFKKEKYRLLCPLLRPVRPTDEKCPSSPRIFGYAIITQKL